MKKDTKKTKQIAIISGKGGTGKTVITAAFSGLAERKVMADADVDAANLHLILSPDVKVSRDFVGGEVAEIDQDICTMCMECVEACRFDAIDGDPLVVIDEFCEGCAACFYVCPVDAIKMREHESGKLFISETRMGPLVHAKLGIAEDNSGKLVSEVRKEANAVAKERDLDLVIIDGPPGIGCPVIAAITGVDLAFVVTEPTVSGVFDLKRILELTSHFEIPTLVSVNKFDINLENSRSIEDEARKLGARVVGEIPYHEGVIESIKEGKSLIEAGPDEVRDEIIRIWDEVEKAL
jgi:MinD superfamily P-loop ATPase